MRVKVNTFIKSSLPFIFITFYLISCEFEPSKVYYLEKEIPTSTDLEIDLNLHDSDTIFYYWQTKIKLTYTKSNKLELYEVNFYIDTLKLQTEQIDSIYSTTIVLNDTLTHSLRIEIITSTGSNSIADELGAEIFYFDSKIWHIIPKKSSQNNLKFSYTNNGLALSWLPYNGLNLKNYLLQKHSTDSEIIVADNYYLDEDYLGEAGTYSLYLIDKEGGKYLWGEATIDNKIPKLRIDTVNGMISLTWNKNGFEYNIKEYEIFASENNENYYLLGTVNSAVNYLPLNDFMFGQYVDFKIKAIPQSHIPILDEKLISYSYETVFGIGGSPTFDNFEFLTSKGFFYRDNDSIFYYSVTNNKIHKLFSNKKYFTSPNGNYLVFPSETKLSLFSLEPFRLIKEIDIQKFVPDWHWMSYLVISDNGILLTQSGGTIHIINLFSSQQIASITYNETRGFLITPNGGKAVFYSNHNADIYEIESNTISLSYIFSDSTNYYTSQDYLIVPDNSDIIYSKQQSIIKTKSLIDLSVLKEINLNNKILNIDFNSDQILTYSNYNLYIYDFNSGNLEYSVPAIGTYSNGMLLLDNTIYYGRGYKYLIQ